MAGAHAALGAPHVGHLDGHRQGIADRVAAGFGFEGGAVDGHGDLDSLQVERMPACVRRGADQAAVHDGVRQFLEVGQRLGDVEAAVHDLDRGEGVYHGRDFFARVGDGAVRQVGAVDEGDLTLHAALRGFRHRQVAGGWVDRTRIEDAAVGLLPGGAHGLEAADQFSQRLAGGVLDGVALVDGFGL